MPKDSKEKAIADAQRAQLAYERDIDAAREARRKSFERAQKAGLSLRDIGDAVGLTTRSVYLLMANENPTGGERAVPLDLPAIC